MIVLVRRDLHTGDPHTALGRVLQSIITMISPVLVVAAALATVLHGLSVSPLLLLDPEESAADPLLVHHATGRSDPHSAVTVHLHIQMASRDAITL